MPFFPRRARRAVTLPLLVTLALVGAGCSRFAVTDETDPKIDFSRFATFGWLPEDIQPPGDMYLQDRSIEKRVKSDVEAGLRAKGYQQAAGTEPDLWITYRLTSSDVTANGLPAGYAGYQLGWWSTWLHATRDSYERGTLMVDAVARDARQLVWRGTASARLLPHLSYQDRVKRTNDAVAQIMKGFPPR